MSFDETIAKEQLENGYKEAKKILNDEKKMEELIKEVEEKLETITVVSETVSVIPTLISLVKAYINKEYRDVEEESIINIVSAFLYLTSPADIIPDIIPGAGNIDDIAVIEECLKIIGKDLENYKKSN